MTDIGNPTSYTFPVYRDNDIAIPICLNSELYTHMMAKRVLRLDSGFGHKRRGFLRWIFAAIFAILLIGLVAGLFVFAGLIGPVGPRPYFGWPFFFFPFGFFVFVFALFFIFRFAFWGWGWGRGGYHHRSWGSDGPYALDILNRRYASGEITKEQYDQMKADIMRKND
jgi:uncharacterized membrane protein